MTEITRTHHRNHENSPESGSENREGLPAAGKKSRSTSRQALNHMSTACGGGISPASAGEPITWRMMPAHIKDDDKP